VPVIAGLGITRHVDPVVVFGRQVADQDIQLVWDLFTDQLLEVDPTTRGDLSEAPLCGCTERHGSIYRRDQHVRRGVEGSRSRFQGSGEEIGERAIILCVSALCFGEVEAILPDEPP
jgi:hypothetical protein